MQLGIMGFRKTVVAGGIGLLALAALSLPGEAGVKPGDFITPDNASQVKDLVSPGVFYKVQRGMTMKITPTERIDWPPPYKDATEKYASQVQLSKDHRSLIGYVAGQLWLPITPNAPESLEFWDGAAVVSPACLSASDPSSLCLPADSVVGRLWN
jgi:hypothetical protein